MSTCPKCQFELDEAAVECPACGIILAKYRAIGTGPAPTVPEVRSPETFSPPPEPVLPDVFPAAPETVNPYAPPVASVEHRAGAAVAVDAITPLTLESLQKARPWMAFLAIYGLVMVAFVVLASLFVLITVPGAESLPLLLIYAFYGLVMAACILPLRRSALALKKLHLNGASLTLETYAVEISSFWRRVGLIAAIGLGLAALGIAAAVLFGTLAAISS